MHAAIDHADDIRSRIQQHWEASESGDIDTEHAIYATDGILDYQQSGERSEAVTHETQYFADPFAAAPGRAALAEPIPEQS